MNKVFKNKRGYVKDRYDYEGRCYDENLVLQSIHPTDIMKGLKEVMKNNRVRVVWSGQPISFGVELQVKDLEQFLTDYSSYLSSSIVLLDAIVRNGEEPFIVYVAKLPHADYRICIDRTGYATCEYKLVGGCYSTKYCGNIHILKDMVQPIKAGQVIRFMYKSKEDNRPHMRVVKVQDVKGHLIRGTNLIKGEFRTYDKTTIQGTIEVVQK